MTPDKLDMAEMPEDAAGVYATADWLAENADISEARAEAILDEMVDDGVFVHDPEPGKYRPGGLLALAKGYAKYSAELHADKAAERLRRQRGEDGGDDE